MLTTFLLICVNVFSQTPFDKGFREGYVDGYMYAAFENNDLNAIKPIPPIPPLPSIHESINSWRNGYDRGYIAGYKSYNSAGSSKNPSAAGNQILRTYPKYNAPDLDLLMAIAMAQAQNESSNARRYYYRPRNRSQSRPKRTKKRIFYIDFAYSVSGISGPACNLILDGQVKEDYFLLGVGVGMVYQKDWQPKKKDWVWYPSYAENPDDLISLPLFVDMRSYFLKKRFSPFIAQKVGYAFVLGRDYNISGFYSDTSVGFRFLTKRSRGISLSAGYTMQGTKDQRNIQGYVPMEESSTSGINIKLGFEI